MLESVLGAASLALFGARAVAELGVSAIGVYRHVDPFGITIAGEGAISNYGFCKRRDLGEIEAFIFVNGFRASGRNYWIPVVG